MAGLIYFDRFLHIEGSWFGSQNGGLAQEQVIALFAVKDITTLSGDVQTDKVKVVGIEDVKGWQVDSIETVGGFDKDGGCVCAVTGFPINGHNSRIVGSGDQVNVVACGKGGALGNAVPGFGEGGEGIGTTVTAVGIVALEGIYPEIGKGRVADVVEVVIVGRGDRGFSGCCWGIVRAEGGLGDGGAGDKAGEQT